MTKMKIAFISSDTKQAIDAKNKLIELYGDTPAKDAKIIVALGGDGLMLQVLHKFITSNIPIYGMNCGSIGFLMNELKFDGLYEKLENSEITEINPLLDNENRMANKFPSEEK